MENQKSSYLYDTLADALTDLGWFHIDNIQYNNHDAIEAIKSYFNPCERDEDGTPVITAQNKTIIVCDNHDFNESYLIDTVSKVLKETGDYKIGKYDLVLVDNVTCRKYLENPKFINYYKEDSWKEIEKDMKACVFIINPEENVIIQVAESEISVIHEDQIKCALKWFDSDFCKANK